MKSKEKFLKNTESKQEEREGIIKTIKEKVEQLSKESLEFSGISQKTYESFKKIDEEYPGYTTPIDELLERFSSEGMKIVLGKHPDSGNVFVLPCGSEDIENDSIPLSKLSETNNRTIKELREAVDSL
jgi:hypothetical protein